MVNAHETSQKDAADGFKPFTLGMIQLGSIGPDKETNLAHSREMILKAAKGDGQSSKVDLIMLPVRRTYSWARNLTPIGDLQLTDGLRSA
jgi:hypothetical protein